MACWKKVFLNASVVVIVFFNIASFYETRILCKNPLRAVFIAVAILSLWYLARWDFNATGLPGLWQVTDIVLVGPTMYVWAEV